MISPLDIELASNASWPAFEQMDYQGWLLRFADGYTKRANSVNAVVSTRGPLSEAVAHCESFYAARQRPAIFRLLSFVEDPALDSFLADRGYHFIEPSLVLCRKLDQPFSDSKKLTRLDLVPWLKIFNDLSGAKLEQQAVHARLLDRIPDPLCVVVEHEGEAVACGLGVRHESYFGIFDIITRPQNRRQGHAEHLIAAMLDWARLTGAAHAYVQVVGHNAPAVRLYEKIGYRRLYHYWYRVRPMPADGIS